MSYARSRAADAALPIVLAALVGCAGPHPPPSPSIPSQAPAPSTTASGPNASVPGASAVASLAPASAPAGTGDWQRTWPGPVDPRRALTAIVARSGGFVVTGADRISMRPVAMSSSDGIVWADESIGGGNVDPSHLAAWGDRVLAVGAGQVPCAHPFGLQTWVRSASGMWSGAPFDDLFCHASDVSIGFVDGHPILVGSGPGDRPVAWSSADGLHWVDRGQNLGGLVPGAVAGDGRSAVLFAQGPTGLWTSSTRDGTAWSAPALIPGLPSDLVVDGAYWIDGAPTLIVSQGDAVEAVRPDGSGAWQRTVAAGLSADELHGVTAFDGGLLAVTGENGIEVLVSRDGTTWRAIDLPSDLQGEEANVTGLAVGGGRVVMISALLDASGNSISVIWTGPAALVAP